MQKKIILSLSVSLLLLSNQLVANEEVKLKDVKVTAQKTEEKVQDVPMSVNLLNEFAIKEASIEQTRNISSYIPNFQSYHGGSRDYFSKIIIRGITNTGIGDPAAALYIDGIPYANIYAFDSPLFDVERIEVLKGPQGSLYGKNTEAGVINIITKEPSNELEGKIGAKVGNYHKKELNAIVNVPIVKDKLLLRVAGLKSKKDGYIKNIIRNENIGNEDTADLRANLLFKPADRLKLNLILGYARMKDKGGFSTIPIDRDKYLNATGVRLDKFEAANDYGGEADAKTTTSALKTNYEFDNFDFISVTGYRYTDNKSTLDGDFTPTPQYIGFNDIKDKSFNQEFRLSSQKDSSFKWLVGAYFSDNKIKQGAGYIYDKAVADAYHMPLYTKDDMRADLNARDMAIFGQSTVRFFDDAFGVTFGTRYEKSKREMKNRTHTIGGANTATPIEDRSKDDNIFLPKLSFDYKFNNNFMLYTTASKGYKAGGYNFTVDDGAQNEYDAEISKSIEVGVKSYISDIDLVLNASIFYTKVDDYQENVQLNPTTVVQKNVSEVDIKGFEIEAIYRFLDDFTFLGSFGYTDAKYGDYIDVMTGENSKGNQVAFIPKYDMNLELKYFNPRGFYAIIGMQGLGSRYANKENQKKLKSYTVYNAKIGYEWNDLDISLGIKNIANKEYYMFGGEAGNIGYGTTTGEARTVMLEANYRF